MVEAASGFVSFGVTPSWNEIKCVLHPAAQSGLLLVWERLCGSWGVVIFTRIILPFPDDTVKR